MPKRRVKILLFIFLGVLIIGILVLWRCSEELSGLGLTVPIGYLEYLHVSIFVMSLTIVYLITYSCMEVDSPSLIMTMRIAESGKEGLTKKKFDELLSDDILVKPRVKNLVHDNLVYMEGEKYQITPKGKRMTLIFIFYRWLLNITRKGG